MSGAVLDQHDLDEIGCLEQAARIKDGSLQALLARCNDLDLAGKVYNISVAQQGHGGYSDVYTGFYSPVSGVVMKIAVKKLRVHAMEDQEFQKKLARELYIWSKLSHPGILRLEGFFLEDSNYPSLVSRWMENGTVLKYLNANPKVDMLTLVTGIAEGIDYLHANDIVHSDIKPDNVLISESGEPLLCDFGISRILAASTTFHFSSTLTGGLRGTIRYMSRELLNSPGSQPATFSKESDVWAFGMTVLALLTKNPPYSDYSIDAQVIVAIALGSLPSRPSDIELRPPREQIMWRLCEYCWKPMSERPPMRSITMKLQQLKIRLESVQESHWSDLGTLAYTFQWIDPSRSISSSSSMATEESSVVATDDEADSNPFRWASVLEEHYSTENPQGSPHASSTFHAFPTSPDSNIITCVDVHNAMSQKSPALNQAHTGSPSLHTLNFTSEEQHAKRMPPNRWVGLGQCDFWSPKENIQQRENRAVTSSEEHAARTGRFRRRRNTWHGGASGSYSDADIWLE